MQVPKSLAALSLVVCSIAAASLPRRCVPIFPPEPHWPKEFLNIPIKLPSCLVMGWLEACTLANENLWRESASVLCALCEQLLRLKWISANALPPERGATATSDRLFTTLDVLLASTVKTPSLLKEFRLESFG